jgi:hypothetical protein
MSKIIYRGETVEKREPVSSPQFLGEIKPSTINPDGIVTFTDGTNNVLPNRDQCRRYGYKFDELTGTCYAFKIMANLNNEFQNTNNSFTGKGNTSNIGVENTKIIGDENETFRQSKNNLIVGYQNRVNSDIQNSIVLGRKADVTTSGSIIIGGNQAGDNLSERQTIILQYGCQSTGTGSGTGGGTVSSGINNLVGNRFVLPENAIIYFHADTVAVRTGGTSASGAVGDFYSAVERGVMINKSGTCTISRERDTIKTSGDVTNWRVNSGVSSDGKTLALQCRGNNDMTIEWNMTVTITMIQTSVSL